MNNQNNKKNITQNVSEIIKKVKSIAKTFSGTGTPRDWINTAIVLLPIIFVSIFAAIMLLYIVVMTPLFAIQDKIHGITSIAHNVGEFFDKAWNFVTGNGFVNDEDKYTNKLEKVYNDYKNKGICIDDTAISAILEYKYIVSNNPDNEENIDFENDNSQKENFDEMTGKVKTLADKQIYNNSISNADMLAYLREGRAATAEERSKMNPKSGGSSSSNVGSGGTYFGSKYNLTDEQVRGLATICLKEQPEAAAPAEASLMANLYELKGGGTSGDADGLYNYVVKGPWFADGDKTWYIEKHKSEVSDELFNKIKDVFVNGNRVLPLYIDEHDCIKCGSNSYDVLKVENNGVEFNREDRSQYISGVTKITTRHNQSDEIPYYTFYSFPSEGSDPFGYTDASYKKVMAQGGSESVQNSSNNSLGVSHKSSFGSTNFDTSNTNNESTTSTTSNTDSTNNNTATTVTPRSTPLKTEVVELPTGLGKVHTWTGWFDWNWLDGEGQPGDIIKKLGSQNKTLGGHVGENELGFITYGKWYAGATTSTFGKNGDMLFVVQDDGSVFPLIIADEKSQKYEAWDHNPANRWGHNEGKCVVEFETGQKWNKSVGECSLVQPLFDHYITKIINIGNIENNPEYIDNVEQALADANLSGVKFIDVGETAGSNISFGSSSSTMKCPGELEYYRPTNAEIESMDYKKGFIYKYYKDILKNYNDVELNYAVENLIREIYEYKESLSSISEQVSTGSSSGLACNISGDFESWRQCDKRWRDIKMGNSSSTICEVGCMVTSIAIQIKKSGTQLLVNDFTPGVFVETLSKNGGFANGSASFANNPASWKTIAPNFEEVDTNVPLTGSREDKTKKLKELLDQGYYVIFTVKPNQGHWVALDRVEGDTVYMMDPASEATKLWDERYEVENTNTYTTFKAIDSAATTLTSTGVCAPATGEYKYYNQAPGLNNKRNDIKNGYDYGSYEVKCRGEKLQKVGCSQMSLAMIASGVVSPDITPVEIADWYCDVGINSGVTTDMIVQDALMEKVGMEAHEVFNGGNRSDQIKKLQDVLSQGYPVLLNVKDHYVAVVPGEGGKVKCLDPGDINKTRDYTMEEFANERWHGETLWQNAYYFTKRS